MDVNGAAFDLISPPRRRLWPLAASLAVGLAAALMATWLLPPDPTPQPVVETTLDNTRVGAWISGHALRDLSFNLDMPERVDLAICLRLAGGMRKTIDGNLAFAGDDTRRRLEDLLTRRPDFFYAEYLLGLWHELHGDAARSSELYASALAHAPAVLVQRYELPGGQPLVGANVATFQVECNRVRHGKHDPSLKLTYFNLTTDADGCIRLPVYDTVYRLFNTTAPDGYTADYPKPGWFESPSHVGLLPVVKVRTNP